MTAVQLGMPSMPPAYGVGNLYEESPFPAHARDELRDEQMRANIGHATHTIRAKRGRVVDELPDWQGLRAAGYSTEHVDDGETALLMARGGGFDLIAGNPPWVRPRSDDEMVIGEFDPWFKLTGKHTAKEKTARRNQDLQDPRVAAAVIDDSAVTAATASRKIAIAMPARSGRRVSVVLIPGSPAFGRAPDRPAGRPGRVAAGYLTSPTVFIAAATRVCSFARNLANSSPCM